MNRSRFSPTISAFLLVLSFSQPCFANLGTLEVLPVDALLYIFDYLELRDLSSVSSTSIAAFRITQPSITKELIRRLEGSYLPLKQGTFIMGPNYDTEGSFLFEKVFLAQITSDFEMAQDPVTQEQFELVMGKDKNHSPFKGANLPMTNLTFEEWVQFVGKLNARLQNAYAMVYPQGELKPKLYRIPTEVEWEYGTTVPLAGPQKVLMQWDETETRLVTLFNGIQGFEPIDVRKTAEVQVTALQSSYSGTSDFALLPSFCVCSKREWEGPSPVDSVQLNVRGFRGMSGNVSEITSTQDSSSMSYVTKGGSYQSRTADCRSASQGFLRFQDRDPHAGLRLVRE